MIRLCGKRDRLQFERVEDRQIEAGQSRSLALKLRNVVAPKVVSNEQLGRCRSRIDAAHDICRVKSTGRQGYNAIAVRLGRADREDPVTVRRVGCDVDRKRRPADDDLSGCGCQSFIECCAHILWLDPDWNVMAKLEQRSTGDKGYSHKNDDCLIAR